jgi:hypothetical protein
MTMPISIRLSDEVRTTLEAEAKSRRLGLSAYLREVATTEARRVQRERIRLQSQAVGEYVSGSDEAAAFYADWGKAGVDNS